MFDLIPVNNRVSSLFKDPFFNLFPSTTYDYSSINPLSIQEMDDKYEVMLDVPGLSKEDIKIIVECDKLFITGEKKGKTYRKFSRTITLGRLVDSNKIEAAIKDGELLITIPKAESAKQREIIIK